MSSSRYRNERSPRAGSSRRRDTGQRSSRNGARSPSRSYEDRYAYGGAYEGGYEDIGGYITVNVVEEEVNRLHYRDKFVSSLRSTMFTLVCVAAVAVLVATLWMPVLRIYGVSMAPALEDGDIIVSLKESNFNPGDIVAFYYNNKILVKRAIASAGDWVDIDQDGNVYVNNVLLNEPYLDPGNKAFGDTNIELPYQVPDGRVFVLGDNRAVSIDSRNTAIGPIASEQVVGRLVYIVWPLNKFGSLKAK